MSAAKLQRTHRGVIALLMVVCLAFGVIVVNGPKAEAANRDWLRPDNSGTCDWDAVGYWVQRCDVWSPSMDRNIPVMVQPASRGGNASLYLLDGMRATNETNALATQTDVLSIYEPHNITLVMPVGGAASFYTDWVGNASLSSSEYIKYKWETFLTQELPAYLQANFGVSPSNNAIGGLSMGGTAAMNLAANHPEQFRQVLSYSGYLTMTLPGVYSLLALGMLDVGSYNIGSMYTSIISPRRFKEDPMWNMDALRNNGTWVYVSAGSGIAPAGMQVPAGELAAGALLEAGSLASSRMWGLKARATGLNFTEDYPATGIHNWANWNDQVHKTRNMVLDRMNAW